MQPFKLTLSNDAIITGVHNLPSPSLTTPKHYPLIICLHGASYSAQYFDVNPKHTASIISNALNVPVVAIDRPGYKSSTSFYPIPNDSSYPQEYGKWLHHYILPGLWTEFGQPNGCNSIALHCHSLGATGAVIAAGMHAIESSDSKSYPLAGISMSGVGCQLGGPLFSPPQDPGKPPSPPPDFVTMPPHVKDKLMLGAISEGRADPSIYTLSESLNNPRPAEEPGSIEPFWLPRWREWAAKVKVPVMIGIAGDDGLWKGTKGHLDEFMSGFTGSARVDGSLVLGAPHNLEMSYWAQGWYARCFGFAMECATSFAQYARKS